MAEITYILGAGASFQSIPIVDSFNIRLSEFAEYLDSIGHNNYVGDKRIMFKDTSDRIRTLVNEFSLHQSFDTYFKKLFHLKKESEINNGKRLLHMYFIWEHSYESLRFFPSNPENGRFQKKALSDKRYDALIAGLLKPSNEVPETICKINFISWNYDLNLLQSIKNFFYPNDTYSKFLARIIKSEFFWEIDSQIKIINVNGYFYTYHYDESENLYNSNAKEVLEKMVLSGYHKETFPDQFANKLKFSWERDSYIREDLNNLLSKCISSTNNVVVIGYTFPIYNRFIDLQYMNQNFFDEVVMRKKRLIIQNPKANEIVELVEDMSSHKYKFEPFNMGKPGCDSFFVPSVLFSTGNDEFFGEVILKSR